MSGANLVLDGHEGLAGFDLRRRDFGPLLELLERHRPLVLSQHTARLREVQVVDVVSLPAVQVLSFRIRLDLRWL